jgi:hypothetical protein
MVELRCDCGATTVMSYQDALDDGARRGTPYECVDCSDMRTMMRIRRGFGGGVFRTARGNDLRGMEVIS